MSGSSITPAGKDGRKYELTVLYAPSLVADLADAVSDTVKYATDAGFKVSKMDISGHKVLPYPIENKQGKVEPKGIYAYFTLDGEGDCTKLGNVSLYADIRVMRWLLVTVK